VFHAAIFDMDGLLIDSERAIMRAWIAAAQVVGAPLSEREYLPLVGSSRQHCYDFLLSRLGSEAAFQLAREHVQGQLSNAVFPLKPGTVGLLERLAARQIPCAVASSSEISEVRRRLKAVGIIEFFSVLAGGDEVAHGKPDPAVYLLAAQRLGHAPEHCLAFEDSLNGIRAARAAAIPVVVVPDLVAPDLTAAFTVLDSLEHTHPHLPLWFGFEV
jgi:HAD superfamily hydrolase (TIGR01509 family)